MSSVGMPCAGVPSAGAPDVAELDGAPRARAEAILAPLFEGAPRFLGRLVAARPFRTWDSVWATARQIAHAMPEPEQVDLLDAHPRLGAARETVSALSHGEQGYDRPRAIQPETLRRLGELNDAYEARFGFRYCVFVAGRPLDALLPAFQAALAADRETELRRGLDAVVDIARARFATAGTHHHRHDR